MVVPMTIERRATGVQGRNPRDSYRVFTHDELIEDYFPITNEFFFNSEQSISTPSRRNSASRSSVQRSGSGPQEQPGSNIQLLSGPSFGDEDFGPINIENYIPLPNSPSYIFERLGSHGSSDEPYMDNEPINLNRGLRSNLTSFDGRDVYSNNNTPASTPIASTACEIKRDCEDWLKSDFRKEIEKLKKILEGPFLSEERIRTKIQLLETLESLIRFKDHTNLTSVNFDTLFQEEEEEQRKPESAEGSPKPFIVESLLKRFSTMSNTYEQSYTQKCHGRTCCKNKNESSIQKKRPLLLNNHSPFYSRQITCICPCSRGGADGGTWSSNACICYKISLVENECHSSYFINSIPNR